MRKRKLFIFFLIILSIPSIKVYSKPDTQTLYVDGFNSVLEEWDEKGSSPWLDNDITNEIYTSIDEEWHEEFTFDDHSGLDIINSVYFYIELKGSSARKDRAECYIWDGTQWLLVLAQDPDDNDYAWYNVNVTDELDSWTKINGAKLKIEYQRAGSPSTQIIYARRSYIYVDYTIIETQEIDPPFDPNLLFGVGFNASYPYVELHWNHSLLDVQFFEIQNSSDSSSWEYLGQSITTNYTDNQVVNGTERYYKVRACNYTDGDWYNSSFSDVNFEKVYFIPEVGCEIVGSGFPPEAFIMIIFLLTISLMLIYGVSRKK